MMSAMNISVKALLLFFLVVHSAFAQIVLEDDGLSINEGEFEFLVSQWPSQMQTAAANNLGDRLELLNKMIMLRRMAAAADNLPPETKESWELSEKVLILKREFLLDNFAANLKVPDMSALSAERYDSEKVKYALVPEKRMSSQILFICAPPCSTEQASIEAQEVLDELRAGADFAALVQTHSDDPGTRAKGGKVDSWITYGMMEVPSNYSQGLFDIDSVGGYSDLVWTEFGIHIIRYDDVEEEHFLPYEEAKDQIVADLETDYRKLSILAFIEQFNITEDLFIDGDAMEKTFAPYKTADN